VEDKHIPELSERELAQWNAVKAAITGMTAALQDGTLDKDAMSATQAQLAQVDLDMARVRDALHVPEDAGEYTEQLTALLRRIPDGWGRWISCDAGWYPLIVGLDADIAALAPDYELHQVKEKFGGLRFYIHAETEDPEARRAIDGLIREAERRALTICERCGEPGKPAQRRG
jgi:hypothetical protein